MIDEHVHILKPHHQHFNSSQSLRN